MVVLFELVQSFKDHPANFFTIVTVWELCRRIILFVQNFAATHGILGSCVFHQ